MIKKLLFKQLFQCIIFGLILLFFYRLQAQCSPILIYPNGTTTVNGIQIAGVSSGDVGQHNNPFDVGLNKGAWSSTLTLSQPVNNLVFLFAPNTRPEFSINAHFNTNGGPVSITPTYGSNNWVINGNTVTKPYNINDGSGNFEITSPNDYTTITINGDAFPSNLQGHYASLALCSAGVLAVNDINRQAENNVVSIYPNPVKNMMIISSKENLKSYKIFDESGRLILSSSLKGNEQNVNLFSIKSGNYIISVETEKQTISTKLIKE